MTCYPWAARFARNRARDLRCRAELAALGWRTLWVWECAVVGGAALATNNLDRAIAEFICGRERFAQIESTGVAVKHNAAWRPLLRA